MIEITNKISDDLVVEEDIRLNGMVVGSAIVRPGKVLIINGTVLGNVVIEQNAEVELNGTVHGDVYNQGGRFHKRGVLSGTVVGREGLN